MKKLFLLDGMALVYRAFFAMQRNPRFTSKGLNTSAILGFANTLYDLIKNENPTHLGVAFDTHAPTARHEEFSEYKANREKMPEDLSASIPYIKRLIRAFDIPILEVDGYEADDVIGTLAKEAEESGYQVYMVTPDKDFGQLVSENIRIYKPAKNGEKAEILGVAEVCEKFGIDNPIQVIDVLAICGDSADNFPGIKGVGPKGARDLLRQFGTLDNVLKNTLEIKNEKLREKVEQGRESAIQSKMLATIILDVPIEFHEENLHLGEPKKDELKELLDELEFRTFAKRVFTDLSLKAGELPQKAETSKSQSNNTQVDLFSQVQENAAPGFDFSENLRTVKNTEHQYILVDTEEKLTGLLQVLAKAPLFCFDTETTDLDVLNAEIVGFSFAVKPHEAYYIPVSENQAEAQQLLSRFREVFENEKSEKVAQNLKYDLAILKKYGIEVKGKTFDTMLAHYLLQPDMRHNMDLLSESYLGYRPISYDELVGKKGKQQLPIRNVPVELVAEYAAEDADITLQLQQTFAPKLVEMGARPVFETIEMPLVPVLAGMENEGIRLDTQALADFSDGLGKEIIQIQDQIWEQAGTHFNINSPQQLGKILFEHLKISDTAKKTATKQYSTAEDVLTKLAHKHPIVQLILDYRSLVKLKSTYVDALPALVNKQTGHVHTSYNQAVAATGRLSSNNPNLQNIPIRTEKGREIRKAFVPRSEEFTLLAADYSQIELRIIASVSGDEGMMNAFTSGMDIHTATAANIFGIAPEEVTKDQRRHAKSVNFGIIYGISAFGLGEQLGIARKEAQEMIDQYFLKFPKIKQYMETTIASARQKGYVETIKGRRRYINDINSANSMVRGFAERNAINAPIQGSAADMIKLAMIDIHNDILDKNLKSRMILQVHDELVFDVYKPELETVKTLVKNRMMNALPLQVPVEVDVNTGSNWLEAH